MMIFRLALPVLALLAASAPAVAFVTVLGTGNAAMCSNAARFGNTMQSDIEYCTIALEQDALGARDRAATFVNRGILRTHVRAYDSAMEDFASALKLRPELPEAFVGRGNVEFMRDKFDLALADYQKALDLGITNEIATRFNRALAREALKQFDLALEDYLVVAAAMPEWGLVVEKLEAYRAAGVYKPEAAPLSE